jgi:hypothetical protein
MELYTMPLRAMALTGRASTLSKRPKISMSLDDLSLQPGVIAVNAC